MQPADIDALVDALKQHRLWGDYTISLDDLEPSYRLHAALRLLLFAEQRNMSPKQAVAQWDRWRRGGAANQTAAEQSADRATQQAIGAWVRAVCQGTATLAQRMLSETGAGERLAQLQEEPAVTVTVTVAVDWFLAQCMHVVWLEINAIAARCLKSL
ncbi:hypothetical protein LPJ56_001221 [Coemansia sp. RSA 2599]|nr:hypothetical protein LPJ56_001221 [Coemansia sp. RSA 2599]